MDMDTGTLFVVHEARLAAPRLPLHLERGPSEFVMRIAEAGRVGEGRRGVRGGG